jgi:hypothetical protein
MGITSENVAADFGVPRKAQGALLYDPSKIPSPHKS